MGLLGSFPFWRLSKTVPSPVIRYSRWMLGTRVTLSLYHPDQKGTDHAAHQAFEAIRKVDQIMSIHRADSELSTVNRFAGSSVVRVDPQLIQILKTAQTIYQLSGGIYDVTALPLLRLYGFYAEKRVRHFPSDRQLREILALVGFQHAVVDEKRGEVGLDTRGAAIDLGSIGKGFAVDEAGRALRTFGIENALIDCGGNLLAIGGPFDVAIQNPGGEANHPYFETVPLKDEGIATSGNYENRVMLDGREVGHLFDAKKGRPVNPFLSTTVRALNATLADALSTASFLLGPESSSRFHGLAREIIHHPPRV